MERGIAQSKPSTGGGDLVLSDRIVSGELAGSGGTECRTEEDFTRDLPLPAFSRRVAVTSLPRPVTRFTSFRRFGGLPSAVSVVFRWRAAAAFPSCW